MAAKLQSGRVVTAPQDAELSSLLRRSMADTAELRQRRRIDVKAPTSGQIGVPNPDWVVLVVASVIDNAVAYGPDRATIEIGAKSGTDGTELTVTDHGPGIPKERLERLFHPFVRAEGEALEFDHEGLGFSLYLDKLIVSYLGGTIALDSDVGKGTTATVRFASVA